MVDTKVPTIILCYYRHGGGNMAGKYTMRSKEEKLAIVNDNIVIVSLS